MKQCKVLEFLMENYHHMFFDSDREMESTINTIIEHGGLPVSISETEIPERIIFPICINGREMICSLEDYNQEWNIRLSGNDEPEGKLNYKTIAETKGNILVWCKDSLGFVHFGAIGKQAHYDQEAGYMWSSRTSVFNGLNCEPSMEGTYNYRCVGIPISWVEIIIETVREHGFDNIYLTKEDKSDGEIRYSLISLDRYWHEVKGKEVI